MHIFDWISPVKIVFGPGSVERLPKEVASFGSRALIISGSSSTAKIVNEQILPLFSQKIKTYGIASREPDTHEVCKLRDTLKEIKPDVVVAVGGGSVIDATKLAAVLVNNDKPIEDFLLRGAIPERDGIPVIAVPTTAGTGSEVDSTSMIKLPEHHLKRAASHELLAPKVAIVDPKLTTGMPPRQTAICGADALTHALECYVSSKNNPISKSLSFLALKYILPNFEKAVRNGADLKARTAMSLGSVVAGVAMLNAGLGLVHALAHPIGGHIDVPHGYVCACLLPKVIRFNAEVASEDYARVASLVGVKSTQKDDYNESALLLADYIEGLFNRCGLDLTINAEGRYEDFPWDSVIDGLKFSRSLHANPRPVDMSDCRDLLTSVLRFPAAETEETKS